MAYPSLWLLRMAMPVTLIFVSSCASLPPPQSTRFNLSVLDSPPASGSGARTIAALDVDSTTGHDPHGDARFTFRSFEPTLLDLMTRRLAHEKLPRLADASFSIRRAHVDAYVQSYRGSAPPGIFNPKMSVAQNIAFDVLALGVVSLLSPSDKVSLIATLEVKVGDRTFFAQGGAVTKPRNLQEGMVRAVSEALDNIVSKLRNTDGNIDPTELTEPPIK